MFGPDYQSSKILETHTRATRVRISPSRESSYTYDRYDSTQLTLKFTIYLLTVFFWQRLVFISLHYVERLRTSIYIYGTQKTIIITCRHNSIPTFKPVSTHIYNIILYYIRTHFSPSHSVYHIIAF